MKSSIKVDLDEYNNAVILVRSSTHSDDVRDKLIRQITNTKGFTPFLLCLNLGEKNVAIRADHSESYSDFKITLIKDEEKLRELVDHVYPPLPVKSGDEPIPVCLSVLKEAIAFIELFKGSAQDLRSAILQYEAFNS